MLKSKGQRTVILGGLILFLLMGLYPPWREVLNYGQGQIISQSVSYASIFNPPELKKTYKPYSIEIDWSRLVIEWICVVVFTIGIVFLVGSRPKKLNSPGFR